MSKSFMFPDSGVETSSRVDEDAARIDASVESKYSKIYASKKLAKFFEFEITLKIFGQVIWHWVFPPQN